MFHQTHARTRHNSSVARYTPWTKGRYEVAPGLRPLGTDFGNGEEDRQVFQFGDDAERLLENKRACLAERPSKYVARHRLSEAAEDAVTAFIRDRLGIGETLSLEELALRVPEDIAIVTTEGETDWLAFGHLCAPSHWALEEKIGRSFAQVHEPIPGFERTAAVAPKMIDAMVNKGPWVRFVWSLESDDRPNHHPDAPPGWDQAEWWGRQFSLKQRFWVRVERQCLIPLPTAQSALFTIRLSWWTMEEILARETLREPLVKALRGMNPEERAYKGIDEAFEALVKLLETRL